MAARDSSALKDQAEQELEGLDDPAEADAAQTDISLLIAQQSAGITPLPQDSLENGESDNQRNKQNVQRTNSFTDSVYMIGGVAYTQAEVDEWVNNALENIDKLYEEQDTYDSKKALQEDLEHYEETDEMSPKLKEVMSENQDLKYEDIHQDQNHNSDQQINWSRQLSRDTDTEEAKASAQADLE